MKPTAQIEREIDDHVRAMRAIESEAGATGSMTSTNAGIAYDRLSADRGSREIHRWIGRCKKCGATHRVDGRLLMGHAPGRHDLVIRATDGRLLTAADQGTSVATLWMPCRGEGAERHHCLLRRVVEGTKRSKHQCGARCTSATGPNCDCRCRGANHGADC